MEVIFQSLAYVMQPLNLLLIVAATFFGMVCGALPGISSSMAIILLLPFTYNMEPVSAIVSLVAVYIGGAAGGSISAILLKIPGTPEAVATIFDGHPMARKGHAGKALGIAISSSSFGGIFSAFVMVVAAPLLANFAIKFQSAEYAMLGLLGLSCITSIGGKDQLKAMISATLGLILSTIGIDPINGSNRFVFDQPFLMNGISYIPVMIGVFAVAEVYKTIGEEFEKHKDHQLDLTVAGKINMEVIKFVEVLRMWKTMLKSAVIGTIIGIIPAAGGSIASLLAYGEAVRSSKTPDRFGTGEPEGIAAPEAANNAAVGGSMVPTMVLGIPGSPTAAVIMAAFMIHNLRPGPLILKDQPILLYAIFIGIIIASIFLFIGGKFITREFAHVLKLPYPLLGTLIIALSVIGAYSLNNSFYDVLIMFAFSLLGFLFNHYKFSSSALILGLILGGIIENSLRKQLIISNGSWAGFVTRPISLVILVLSIFGFLSPMLTRRKAEN